MEKLISLTGMLVILGIAYLMSNNRSKISLRVVV